MNCGLAMTSSLFGIGGRLVSEVQLVHYEHVYDVVARETGGRTEE
jgi:hypothetical protein